MKIIVKPVKGREVTDENGDNLIEETNIIMNEFWARRIVDGDLTIVKEKGKRG